MSFSKAQAKVIKRVRTTEKEGEVTPSCELHKATLNALVRKEILEVTSGGNVLSTDFGKETACFEFGISEDDRK